MKRRGFLGMVGGVVLSETALATPVGGMARAVTASSGAAKEPPLFERIRPEWEIKFLDAGNNVMSVMPGESNKTFFDPLIKREVKWEQDAYCPACAVSNDRIYCVYRAWGEDEQWRHGSAWSKDGLHFVRSEKPVHYPRPEDEFLGSLRDRHDVSITYGDPRAYVDENGLYYLFYNYLRYEPAKGRPMQELAVATSHDMLNWTEHGRAFAKRAPHDADLFAGKKLPRLWPAIVTRLNGDRLLPVKINGKYWMYISNVEPQLSDGFIATSENMLDWEIYRDTQGHPAKMLALRPGYFDSNWIDPVAAVLRDDGVLLIYNGINAPAAKGGDSRRQPYTHYPAQALFDRDDPTRLLRRSESPFKGNDPELEKLPIVFWSASLYEAWSLVVFKNQLLLYWNNVRGRRSVGLWTAPIPDNLRNVRP